MVSIRCTMISNNIPKITASIVSAGWACAPLSVIQASHEDCLGSATYDGSTWSISTKKVILLVYIFIKIFGLFMKGRYTVLEQ